MTTDPAVRSICIAATLNQRFGTIIDSISFLSRSDTPHVVLKTGEAQQIYPEIWRHLDAAREVMAARGVDVAVFDKVRATELPGTLGVAPKADGNFWINAAVGIDLTSLEPGKRFNTAGHDRAASAIAALMRALPAVDWDALAREEASEIARAGSLTAGMHLRSLRWLVGIAVLFGAVIVAYKLLLASPDRATTTLEPDPPELTAARAAKVDRLVRELATRPCDRTTANELYATYLAAHRNAEAAAFKSQHARQCTAGSASSSSPQQPE